MRGLRPRQITALAGLEAALIGLAGGLAGLGVAALTGRLAFGAASFGAGAGTWAWYGTAFVLGAAVAAGPSSSPPCCGSAPPCCCGGSPSSPSLTAAPPWPGWPAR
ncbi:hypothetical protein [Streptomyces anandii]|uniref:hypothetical protein n=1 Tax=Streptomyces anandii TaxID=285454 RepID=UPI0019BEE4B3|nr:hypothetical protein [Streptomyces anandii]GGY13524.1 hypothetical protein GCM10010510_69460 [Streptomyces anandii JCM 4720]